MFRRKTVFVIGAGASCEFSLPSGDGLKSVIRDKLNILFSNGMTQSDGDETIAQAFKNRCVSIGERDINQFLFASWRIRDAMPQCLSIDNFLDAHQSDAKINLCGKLAIAQSIIQAEMNSMLMSKDQSGGVAASTYSQTWLAPFAQRLTEGIKREDASKIFEDISFVVFNYDRCLEVALHNILQNYYFISADDAASIVSGAEIYHPYGSLGRLPWQLQSSSGLTVRFGEVLSGQKLLLVAEQIRTFTEKLDDEAAMLQIKRVIGEAEKIVFLGFGFHDLNMQLLSSQNVQVNEIYGTVLGASTSDVRVSESSLKSCLKRPELPSCQLAYLTTFDFLRQYGRAICL